MDGMASIYELVGVGQKLAYDTSAQSTIFETLAGAGAPGAWNAVRLLATTDCHVKFGSNPTALADGTCLALSAMQAEVIRVPYSQTLKLAAIKEATAGSLFIYPVLVR